MGRLSRFDLNRIIKEYKTLNLFETGTFWGDGVSFALGYPFSKIISVEIIPEIAAIAKSRFEAYKKVDIFQSDSITALEKQLPLLKGNTVFWLDAHFPGADAKLADYASGDDNLFRLPLKKELEMICSCRKGFQDVFIIDDLRIYEDGPFENGPVPENAMPKGNRNIDFVFRLFEQTHYVFKSYLDEGYILLFPLKVYNRTQKKYAGLIKRKTFLEDHYLLKDNYFISNPALSATLQIVCHQLLMEHPASHLCLNYFLGKQ